MYVCIQKDNNSQKEKHERDGITHESTHQNCYSYRGGISFYIDQALKRQQNRFYTHSSPFVRIPPGIVCIVCYCKHKRS